MSIDARRYVDVLAAGTPPGTQAETDLAAATLAGAIAGDEAGRVAGAAAGAQVGTEVASSAGAAAGAAAGEIAGAAAGTGAGATAGATAGTAAGTTAGTTAGTAAANAVVALKADKATLVSAAGLATGGGSLAGDRTITVTAADQAQAEAGSATTAAMTPQRTTQHFNARSTTYTRSLLTAADAADARTALAVRGAVELAASGGFMVGAARDRPDATVITLADGLFALAVTPDQFTGTDDERLQAALEAAGDVNPGSQLVASILFFTDWLDIGEIHDIPPYVSFAGVGPARCGLRATSGLTGAMLRATVAADSSVYLGAYRGFGLDGTAATGDAMAWEIDGQKHASFDNINVWGWGDTNVHAVQLLGPCYQLAMRKVNFLGNKRHLKIAATDVSFPTSCLFDDCTLDVGPNTADDAVLIEDASGMTFRDVVAQSGGQKNVYKIIGSKTRRTAHRHRFEGQYLEDNGGGQGGAHSWHLEGYRAAIIASISGTTMTVTTATADTIGLGLEVEGPNVKRGTVITAFGTGAGGTGTYTVSISQTVGSANMTVTNYVDECSISYTKVHGAAPDGGHIYAKYTDRLQVINSYGLPGHKWIADGGGNRNWDIDARWNGDCELQTTAYNRTTVAFNASQTITWAGGIFAPACVKNNVGEFDLNVAYDLRETSPGSGSFPMFYTASAYAADDTTRQVTAYVLDLNSIRVHIRTSAGVLTDDFTGVNLSFEAPLAAPV